MKRSCIFGLENKKLYYSSKKNESFKSKRGEVIVSSHRLWDELRTELSTSYSVSCKRSKSLTSSVAEPIFDPQILERSQSWDGVVSSLSSMEHENVNVGDTNIPTASYRITKATPQQEESTGTSPETRQWWTHRVTSCILVCSWMTNVAIVLK